MAEHLKTPLFPEDFKLVRTLTGTSYWWWSEDDLSQNGLMMSSTTLEDEGIAEVRHMDAVVISWEYGPETESGPWTQFVYESDEPECIVEALAEVVRQVNEERSTHPAQT